MILVLQEGVGVVNKIILSIFLCIIFVCTFSIISFAVTPYASITESSSQVTILLDALYNDPEFSVFSNFLIIRTGDLEYCAYFNIEEGNSSASVYRYYAVQSGYNQQWYLDRQDINNFSYNPNQYLVVGNSFGSLNPSSYRLYVYQFISKTSLTLLMFVIPFFVFRIRKRSGGICI